MRRNQILTFAVVLASCCHAVRADVVTDWNLVIHDTIQNVPAKANPGESTRAIAMMNGAIYDVFQTFDRTHQPFLVRHLTPAAGASLEAAVAQAAHDVLVDCYEEEELNLNSQLASKLAGIDPAAKAAGIALGSAIAQKYIAKRNSDNSNAIVQYTGPGGIGRWEPDPRITPTQEAWGPGWGTVKTWVLPNSGFFDVDDAASGRYEVPGPPQLDSDAYKNAYDMVVKYGSLVSPDRTADQEQIGLFWAYDRPAFGPPPVMFVRNLVDVASQTANTPAENARMFAMASAAMADAAIASWDIKFKDDFWRPITAIRAGDLDGNPDTAGIPDWEPLGAPNDPNDPLAVDFTPPFPAYTSGHATMGGALFKSLELFFGTNSFADIAGASGLPGDGSSFRLFSDEPGAGGFRDYLTFTHSGLIEDLLEETSPQYSPDAENALSRIFLGIHWVFDQQDGMDLGHAIADYVAANRFIAVPEPASAALLLLGIAALSAVRRRRR